jgi:hypothetical protein
MTTDQLGALADDRIPLAAYWPTFFRSLVMVPMGADEPRGALGVYWATTGQTISDENLAALIRIADEAGRAVVRLGLHAAPWAPNFAPRTSTGSRPPR